MNGFSHNFITKNSFADNQELLYGAVQPDIDECEDAFSHHFYNPVTLKDFYGSDDTAKNRSIWHFCEFLITGSFEQLGRSLHFLEDICTPVHTQYEDYFDAVYRLKLHTNFEKKLDSYISDGSFKRSMCFEFIPSFVDLINHCALVSSSLYDDIKNQNEFSDYFLSKTLNLASDSVENVSKLILLNSLKAKKLDCVNVLIEGDSIIPSMSDSNIIARADSHRNVFVFKRTSKLSNFHLVDKFFID